MHTIKITPNLLFVYKRQIYQIAESNRIAIFLSRIGMLYFLVAYHCMYLFCSDMVNKLLSVTPRVTKEHSGITRGNNLRLDKHRSKYDLRRYFFALRVVSILNSLITILSYATLHVNKFKSYLDEYWQ